MPERRSKYNSAQTVHDGIVYDSRLECEVARVLDLLQKQGRLRYQRQAPFVLAERRPGERAVAYVADFLVQVWPTKDVVIEAKGYETPAGRLKIRWFKEKYPDIPLRVVHAPDDVIGVIEELERARAGKETNHAEHTDDD